MLINLHTHHFDSSADIQIYSLAYPFETEGKTTLLSAGIHPWYIKKYLIDQQLDELSNLLKEKKVVAIGECGLDRFIDIDFNVQEEVFIRQLELSEQYQLPLIIHNVKAGSDFLRILKKHKPEMPWIFHGYRGSEEEARKLLEYKVFFSFGTDLFKDDRKMEELVRITSLDRIFFETDSSGMMVESIYELYAQMKSIEMDELKKQIQKNFNKIF